MEGVRIHRVSDRAVTGCRTGFICRPNISEVDLLQFVETSCLVTLPVLGLINPHQFFKMVK